MSCKRKGKNQNTTKSAIIIPLVMGTLFLAIGVGLFIYFDQCKELGKASANWDSTSGVVTERFTRTAKRNTHGDSFSSNNKITYYNIQYVYYVNGKKYTGDRIRIGGNNDCSSGDRQIGNKITVYYDPKSPNNSALIKGYAGENEQVLVSHCISFNGYYRDLTWVNGYAVRIFQKHIKSKRWRIFRTLDLHKIPVAIRHTM